MKVYPESIMMLVAHYSPTYDAWTVADTSGNRWHPSDAAQREIKASDHPATVAVRMAAEQPMQGDWK